MISDEKKVVRGVYPKEASFRIISIIVALSAISLAWFSWFIFDMGWVIGNWNTLKYPLDSIFLLLIDVSLSSIVIFALLSYLLIPRTIRKMALVRCEKEDRLSVLVRECASTAKVGKSPIVLMDSTSKNMAFTIGRSAKHSQIIVNQGLAASLEEEELSSMLFHELGHVANGDVGLMTWASVFQKSLKYWIFFYASVLIAYVVIFFPSPKYVGDWIRAIFFGSGLSYSIIVPIVIYFFVTLSVKSASRVREFDADDFATRYVTPSVLLSFMRNSILYFVSVGASPFNESRKKKFDVLSPLRLKTVRLLAHHPGLKERVSKLKDKQQGKMAVRLPTIETSVYVGLVAAIFAIGWLELLIRSDPFFGLITATNWLVMWALVSLPSVAIFVILNTLPLWCDKEILRNVRGKKLSNAVSKGFLINIIVSGLCYFLFLTLMFHPFSLIDLYMGITDIAYLWKSAINVLSWNLPNAFLAMATSLIVFLELAVKKQDKSKRQIASVCQP